MLTELDLQADLWGLLRLA